MDNIANYSTFDQIIARAIRFRSHLNLPVKERCVNIYIIVPSSPDLKELTKYEEKWIEIY